MTLTRNRNETASYLTPCRARNEAIKALEAHPGSYLFEVEESNEGADRGFTVAMYSQTRSFLGWLPEPSTC